MEAGCFLSHVHFTHVFEVQGGDGVDRQAWVRSVILRTRTKVSAETCLLYNFTKQCYASKFNLIKKKKRNFLSVITLQCKTYLCNNYSVTNEFLKISHFTFFPPL